MKSSYGHNAIGLVILQHTGALTGVQLYILAGFIWLISIVIRLFCSSSTTIMVHMMTALISQQRDKRMASVLKVLSAQASGLPSSRSWNGWLQNLAILSSTALIFGSGYVYKQVQHLKKSLQHIVPPCAAEQKQVFIYPEVQLPANFPPEHIVTVHRKKWFPGRQKHKLGIWAVLRLAQSEDQRARTFAVQAMANVHHWPWTDAEYCMIAQALDHQTLVALAHTTNADPRFFLPPPHLPPCVTPLDKQFHELLRELPTYDIDNCTGYFMDMVQKHFDKKGDTDEEEEITVWNLDGKEFLDTYPVKQSNPQTYMQSLQAMLGHSKIASHCRMIVDRGGLVLLRQVLEFPHPKKQIVYTVSKIIANLTYDETLHGALITAGWITILAEWMRGDDLTLVLQASKALANLDKDHDSLGRFSDGVHLYHPQYRSNKPVYADIIFVHGLLGGPVWTWRQGKVKSQNNQPKSSSNSKPADGVICEEAEGGMRADANDEPIVNCWPKQWLPKDCPNIRVLTVEFETQLSDWAPKCPYDSDKRTLSARSVEFLEKLKEAGVGNRPIVWVGHSMGGLLIKKMLLLAQGKSDYRNLVKRTHGIVFYSVPNRGSNLAAISKRTQYLLYPSVEVKELALNSPQLLQLHTHFTDLLYETGIQLLSFGEVQPIQLPLKFKAVLVPGESSDPGIGKHVSVADVNHIGICKPESRESPLYQLTLQFIRDSLHMKTVFNTEELMRHISLESS